jgi:CheY-like chemotaxis protein
MKKILFIDDDKLTMTSFYEDLLQNYFFEVVWVQDAEFAIQTLENTKFDAIIMDIMMPLPKTLFNYDEKRQAENGLSTGVVLFKKIRELYPKLPILIYSAKGEVKVDEFSYYFRKPELTKTVVDKIEKMTKHEK